MNIQKSQLFWRENLGYRVTWPISDRKVVPSWRSHGTAFPWDHNQRFGQSGTPSHSSDPRALYTCFVLPMLCLVAPKKHHTIVPCRNTPANMAGTCTNSMEFLAGNRLTHTQEMGSCGPGWCWGFPSSWRPPVIGPKRELCTVLPCWWVKSCEIPFLPLLSPVWLGIQIHLFMF